MRRLFGLLAVLSALLALAGCGKNHFPWTNKITVVVETPSGEVSGSSVINVIATGGGKRLAMDGPNSSSVVTGEAPVVDLGGGKYVFALLIGDGKTFKGKAQHIAEFAFCTPQQMSPGEACFAHLRDMAAGTSTVLEPANYPMLVTFDDTNDPKTVKLVDPENLAATFGEGFALKSISVEITDEKVTEGEVEKVLGWIIDAGRQRMGVVPKAEDLKKPRTLSELSPEERIELGWFLSGNYWSSK